MSANKDPGSEEIQHNGYFIISIVLLSACYISSEILECLNLPRGRENEKNATEDWHPLIDVLKNDKPHACTDTHAATTGFGFIYGVERVTSSRLGQSDDVVLDLLGLHHQIFNGRFRCKRTCVISTDRHPSPFPFR
ncbi:hypothetical protein NECAME_05656 [Necator americanus]|uniref:Uncharacterized protein n=1 Tax=Necator americanus TaxID=51031 RepID=W2SFF1_NECAM|nr:hypothetical protein NECAME_05656 [Necator americanus]ETN68290.1 hypothetical protein NECAME_05656 [Necator americanus]